MNKLLPAQAKARELGITTSGLAKTRHLYRHIKKSPRKYLYFAEDPREAVRPNTVSRPDIPVNSSPPRSHRRRGVPFGEENYHKCPSGSGEKLKVLNQMRAKASLEGSATEEELKYLKPAMAIKIKENAKEIVEEKRARRAAEIQQQYENERKKDPRRYGQFNMTSRYVDVSTDWKPLFPKEKTEYDLAQEELEEERGWDPKYY